ncbi:MAG: hypothetical protein ABIJ57_15570 [Pseudomonadota bacterium]
MGDAKQIIVKPISAKDGKRIICGLHYSGKVASTGRFYLGVFLGDRCGGAFQFGAPMNRRSLIGLVKGTLWNNFLELNRLAMADWLPRNGESRAIAYAMRFIKKTYPHVQWVVSFADGCQCGDGTIYRASGFVLTGIKENAGLVELPSGEVIHYIALGGGHFSTKRAAMLKSGHTNWHKYLDEHHAGWKMLVGFQLRYIYFLDPTAKDRLTVPILPFSEIERRGAGMYKGIKRPKQAMASDQEEQRRGSADPDAPYQKET